MRQSPCSSSAASESRASISLPSTVTRTMFVCESFMSTVARRSALKTVASIYMRLLITPRRTFIRPSATISRAFSLSASVTAARHSSPSSGFAAISPSAAAYSLPKYGLFGMPQVKAFLYIPLFSTTSARSPPPIRSAADATARAIAPGSVTPRAGFMSSLISFVSACIVVSSSFDAFLRSARITKKPGKSGLSLTLLE